MAKAATNGGGVDQATPAEPVPICGIVMPISAIDGCSAAHWDDVLGVVTEAAHMAGFKGRLVSAADYPGIILGEIVDNLYSDPIVVCDVSARNPNVMFELGMRLAFDMPTIVIKDDKTEYAFDTQAIEHLAYPRDLRYQTILEFRKSLADKIKATHDASMAADYKSFLKHFGQFRVASIDTTQVSRDVYVMEEIKEMKGMIAQVAARVRHARFDSNMVDRRRGLLNSGGSRMSTITVRGLAPEEYDHLETMVQQVSSSKLIHSDREKGEAFIEFRGTRGATQEFASMIDIINKNILVSVEIP